MIDNNEIYVIMDNEYKNIGYSNSENKAKKFCEDKELTNGTKYYYNLIHNIDAIKNERPDNINFKAFYEVSKEMLNITNVIILGKNKVFESDWPIIEKDKESRQYFYFNMDIDSSASKKKILEDARLKADELLDFTYNNNSGFMHFVNKQILLKEGII